MLIEKLQGDIAKKEGNLHHVQRLLSALGNPSEWSYTGRVIDAGPDGSECACTHPIRWCFIIKRNGNTAQVGSTCINHIASISPELGQVLIAAKEKLEAELAETVKKIKRARADEENQKLWEEYCLLRDRAKAIHRANRADYRKSPYQLWWFCEHHDEKYRKHTIPEYTREADLKRWLKKAIESVTNILKDI